MSQFFTKNTKLPPHAIFFFSKDDSDDLEEDSDEGETDSGDEEEECDVNGDDDEAGEENGNGHCSYFILCVCVSVRENG